MTECPWCKEPMSEHPALSRLSTADERIYVCSECGIIEALMQFDNGGVPYDWRGEA